jgi:hypothetical protein
MEPSNVNPRRADNGLFRCGNYPPGPLDRNARLDLYLAGNIRAGKSIDSILNRFIRVNDAPTFSGA